MIHFFAIVSDAPGRLGNLATAERMAQFFRQRAFAADVRAVDNRLIVGHAAPPGRRLQPEDLFATCGDHVLTGALALFNRDDLAGGKKHEADSPRPSDMQVISGLRPGSLRTTTPLINGDFALLRFGLRNGSLELARDHLGQRPLYFATAAGSTLVSTSVPALLSSGEVSRDLDEMVLASYAALGAPLGSSSYYRAISCLPPASTVEFVNGRAGSPERYWRPADIAPLTRASAADVDETISFAVETAVRSRVSRARSVGVRLSGGLDSSLIAALVCRDFPDKHIVSVSTVLPRGHAGNEEDERRYVEHLARVHPNLSPIFDDAHAYSVLEGADDNFEWLAAPCCLYDYFASKSVLSHLRENGVDLCLTGFGGDQFLSSDGEGYLPEALMSGNLNAFRAELRRLHAMGGASLPRIVYGEVLGALLPRWVVDLRRRLRGASLLGDTALRDDVMRQSSFEDYARSFGFHHTLARPRSMRENHLGHLLNVHEWPLNGIEGAIGEFHGISVQSPLLDRGVVEAVLAVPSRFKVSASEGRSLVRRTFAGILPDEILHRHDKGSPFPDFKRRLRGELAFLRKRFVDFQAIDLWRRLIDVAKVERGLREVEDQSDWEMSFDGLQRVIRPYFLGEFLERHARDTLSRNEH